MTGFTYKMPHVKGTYCNRIKRATIRYPGGGGGGAAGVCAAGKLFISTGHGGALKNSHFITCLYRTVLELNHYFHTESARNHLFQKNSSPPGN